MKKIIVGILNILLINLIIALIISLSLKDVLRDNILKEIIKEQIKTDIHYEPKEELTINQDKINEILESDVAKELINKYFDITIDSMIDEKKLDDIAIEKDIFLFLKENKEVFEKEFNITITDEILNKTQQEIENQDMSKALKQNINNTRKNLPKETELVLKIYKTITSTNFKIITIVFILLNLLLIALIQKSSYKWIKSLGVSATISGLSVIVMTIIIKAVISKLANFSNLNMNNLKYNGIILLITGLVLIIIENLINKWKNKENKDYEVSNFSE